MDKDTTLAHLLNPGVIAIIRTTTSDDLLPAVEAMITGGLRAVEVTMTTPGALESIRKAAARFGNRAAIGVGTVISAAMAHEAIASGAQFVVTPITKQEIIDACNASGIPIACGAYTPTEALLAHEGGADLIKIFPAEIGGAPYIKAIKAPLPQLQLVPTGGVTPENIAQFIRAGASAVGVGSNLVNAKILASRDWAAIEQISARYVTAISAARTAT